MKNMKRFLLVFIIAFVVIGVISCNEQAVMHTVVFANTQMEDAEVPDGEKLARPSAPTQEGHEFIDWYEDAEFNVLFKFTQAITSDITIYAKFSLLLSDVKYTVNFANTDLTDLQAVEGEKLAKPSVPIQEGYTFYDWYDDAEFTSLFDFDQAITADTTIYARFSTSISNATAIANALEHDTQTDDKYYLSGTVKSISNIEYGNMVITNGQEDFVIYGVFSSDGTLRYDQLAEKPVVGDRVYLYGVLGKFYENLEMKNSWLMDMQKAQIPEFDLTDYSELTIAQSRQADVDSKVVIEGIVSRITFANGMSPNGFFLVDETGSIYVYDYDIAASVTAGDTIKVAGVRKNFILADEVNQAEKLGYQGAIQLTEASLVSKTEGTLAFSKDGIEEKTIKELLNADASQVNITGNIYKVNAFIKEVKGKGYTNFYINDLDGLTGSYSYSMNNGNDFTWLREYDGQLKTIYLAVINAKSTSNGLVYRFVPIAVEGDFTYQESYNPILAVKYFGLDQFLNEYFFSPNLELLTNISVDALNVSNIELTYTSNNTDSVFFEEVGGVLIFKTGVPGSAIVTITGIDGGNTYSETLEIIVKESSSFKDAKTVEEVIAEEDETIVIVEGVVGASLVNKSGFYLIDETGLIAVEMISTELDKLSLGQLVIITGKKTHAGTQTDEVSGEVTSLGQIAVREATILVNKYGNHEYSTASFKTGKVLGDFTNLDKLEDHSTDVYTLNASVVFKESQYYSLYTLEAGGASMNIYSSGASQLSFLEQFKGKEVTIEFTVVNWNGKKYVGSIISVTYAGVKTVNNSNFNN